MTDILNDLFGKLTLSRAKIQEIVNHPENYDEEYYLSIFKIALAQGITKETK